MRQAFEQFCHDYKLDFKRSEEIDMFDFFRAGAEYADLNRIKFSKENDTFRGPLEHEGPPKKQSDPDESGWYDVISVIGDRVRRYFDGDNWYRRGSELVDMGDELCIVGRPYSWSEM